MLAIEPIPATFKALTRNIVLNEFETEIEAMNIGLGSEPGNLQFSADQDTVNHVLAESESARQIVDVPIRTLDDVLTGREPVVIKIDVEGFESEVLAGGEKVLACPDLLAVIIELNGSGKRYGQDDDQLHVLLQNNGFESFRYEPVERKLIPLLGGRNTTSNTLYLKNQDIVRKQISISNSS